MLHRGLTSLIILALGSVAWAEPATRPANRPTEGYRLLGAGSWIETHSTVKSTPGFPVSVRRKFTVEADAATGRRSLSEMTWSGVAYEPAGAAQPLLPIDQRSFDELGFEPDKTLADQRLVIAKQPYTCIVQFYAFREADGRSTRLTLYREKSGQLTLPPRTINVHGRLLPLPADAIGADVDFEAPEIATHCQRRVTSLATPMIVGPRTIACVVESLRTTGKQHDKPVSITGKEWHAPELPGEKLRSVTTTDTGHLKIETDQMVLAFQAVPAPQPIAATRPSRPAN